MCDRVAALGPQRHRRHCCRSSRASSTAGGRVSYAVSQSGDEKQRAPPDSGVQMEENHRDSWRMNKLIETRAQDQHAVEKQRDSDEEPDRNGLFGLHQPHQKITFRMTKTIVTAMAQNAGRS